MAKLSDDQRNRAIGMLNAGMPLRAVARALNCHHVTIARLHQRFVATGRVGGRPRSGRPRVTTPQQDQ